MQKRTLWKLLWKTHWFPYVVEAFWHIEVKWRLEFHLKQAQFVGGKVNTLITSTAFRSKRVLVRLTAAIKLASFKENSPILELTFLQKSMDIVVFSSIQDVIYPLRSSSFLVNFYSEWPNKPFYLFSRHFHFQT